MNRPSIAGVSQSTRRWSAKAAADATGSRSIRQRRDGRGVIRRPARSMPVPSVARPERAFDLGRDRPGAVALDEGDILQRGAAQAAARAPGTRWLR